MKISSIKALAGIFGICLAAITLSSCSEKKADLYAFAGAEDDVVCTLNLRTVAENAGCTFDENGLTLTPALEQLLQSESKGKLDTMLQLRGVAPDLFVLAKGRTLPGRVAFGLTDSKAFVKWVKDMNPGIAVESKDGYQVLHTDDGEVIFVKSNYAIGLVDTQGKGTPDIDELNKTLEAVKAQPLPAWRKDGLKKGNALNLSTTAEALATLGRELGSINPMPAEIAEDSFLQVNTDLDGSKLLVKSAIFDKDGKQTISENFKPVDASLLKYASSNDAVVFMSDVPADFDWNSAVKAISAMLQARGLGSIPFQPQVVDVLKSIEGTVMVAAGPVNLQSVMQPAGWDAVVAAQMKEGKAKSYAGLLKGLADGFGFNPTGTPTDFSVKFPARPEMQAFTLYIKVVDETFLVSLSPLTGQGDCKVAESTFAGKSAGLAVNLPNSHFLTRIIGMPFGADLRITSGEDGGTFMAEVTDTQEAFLAAILNYYQTSLRN